MEKYIRLTETDGKKIEAQFLSVEKSAIFKMHLLI